MKSYFFGHVIKKSYWLEIWNSSSHIYHNTKTIEERVFYEVDLPEPPLKAGQEFYIHELNKSVLIQRAMRGTNDTMVYFTGHTVEFIDDKESLYKSEQSQKELEAQRKPHVRGEYKKPTFWQRLFGKSNTD